MDDNKERRERLEALEAEVADGLQAERAYIRAGLALQAIREEQLYIAEHRTFGAYCKAKWGFGDSRARQLIRVARRPAGP